jgi:hypothetical protein
VSELRKDDPRSYVVPGLIGFSEEHHAPDFCGDCGNPFPWASRQARIYELMNLLDAEQLDPAAELKVREQLQALADADEDEEAEEAHWQRVKQLAPTLREKSGAQQIITTLVLSEARVRLGLPPSRRVGAVSRVPHAAATGPTTCIPVVSGGAS